jgi:hypothetical protein
MPESIRSTALDPGHSDKTSQIIPIRFVTEGGATVTIMLDPADAGTNPAEALVRAKDAVRCLADAFGRAEQRLVVRQDEAGAVFRSWAYRS